MFTDGRKNLSAIKAKNIAQQIAFSPIYFQAIIAMKRLGILSLLAKNKKGVTIKDIADKLKVSQYGVGVLTEAAANIGVIENVEPDKIVLTKVGYFINSDVMTEVNFNFVNDVCYDGAKFTEESVKTGRPVGLKTLGKWKTIYEGIMLLPE